MKKLILISSVLALFAACAHTSGPMAMVMLAPTAGNTARGMVHFADLGGGTVEVKVDLTGVPAGVHGFHVHDKGDCGDNGNAAVGHFNQTGAPHGAPDSASHHAGDFGNVTADANGEVHTTFTTHSITINTGMTGVVGHAIILHANPDDLVSQPSGNAGPRIACGVAEAMAMH